MKIKSILAALAAASVSLFSLQATANPLRGGTCLSVGVKIGNYPGGASPVWKCQHLGEELLSISQIYEKGFKVIAVYTPLYNGEKLLITSYTLIIEEQKP